MKLRQASALTLVGWCLMRPPLPHLNAFCDDRVRETAIAAASCFHGKRGLELVQQHPLHRRSTRGADGTRRFRRLGLEQYC